MAEVSHDRIVKESTVEIKSETIINMKQVFVRKSVTTSWIADVSILLPSKKKKIVRYHRSKEEQVSIPGFGAKELLMADVREWGVGVSGDWTPLTLAYVRYC